MHHITIIRSGIVVHVPHVGVVILVGVVRGHRGDRSTAAGVAVAVLVLLKCGNRVGNDGKTGVAVLVRILVMVAQARTSFVTDTTH